MKLSYGELSLEISKEEIYYGALEILNFIKQKIHNLKQNHEFKKIKNYSVGLNFFNTLLHENVYIESMIIKDSLFNICEKIKNFKSSLQLRAQLQFRKLSLKDIFNNYVEFDDSISYEYLSSKDFDITICI